MDELDMKIIEELERDSRVTNTAIASKLGISEGTVRKRIQKLVDERVIRRFTLELSTKSGFTAFTLVKTDPQLSSEKLIRALKRIRGIRRIFDLAGKIDYMVEIVTSSPQDFNEIIDRIRKLRGVENTESLVVLRIS